MALSGRRTDLCLKSPPPAGLVILSLLFLPLLAAQTPPNTASLAGKVRDEKGLPVRAIVHANSGLSQQHTFAGPDGAFQFTKLPAGTYFLCAQVPLTSLGPKDDPFVDSCAWQDFTSPRLPLLAGQAKLDAIITVKRGHLLTIRVNDPAKLLPATAAKSDSRLSLSIAGPAKLPQEILISSKDAAGRTHSIVIPYDTAHKLAIHTSGFALKDANARDLDEKTPLDVKVSPGGPAPILVINVIQAVKK